jgi:hypothetical protein
MWNNFPLEFAVTDGKIDEEGILGTGDPHHIIATCGECDHNWRLRGVSQIDELRVSP